MKEIIRSEPSQPRRTRRTFSKQFKAELVARVNLGEQSLAQIALEHKINANRLHKWVAAARESEQPQAIVPVAVVDNGPASQPGSSFELHHACGTFRFSSRWDPASVALLIKALT